MKKKIFAAAVITLLCCAMFAVGVSAATVWDGTAASGFAGGTGTESDPYRIATAEQLAYLARTVNHGNTYEGVYFQQTADIMLNGTSSENWQTTARQWTPIGNSSSYVFSGTFDGNGYTISGLYISTQTNYQGLFGYTYNAALKNITVRDADVTGGSYTGAMVGLARYYVETGDAAYTLSGCTVKDSAILGEEYVGGLVGYVYGFASGSSSKNKATLTLTLDSCSNVDTSVTGKLHVGGIAGYYEHVVNSSSYASVSTTFTDCVNSGAVSAPSSSFFSYAGGIAGYCYSYATFTDCVNSGEVSSSSYYSYAGGIAGSCYSSATFTDCVNSGAVSAPSSDSSAGGIAGYCDSYATFTDCVNSGAVSAPSSDSYAGGIAGYCYSSATFTDCTNNGEVSSPSYAGGIAGYCSSYATFTNCTSGGGVSSSSFDSYAGGIAGYCLFCAIFTDCTNNGDVSASSSHYSSAGGIAGYCYSFATFTDCTNNGDVSSDFYAGGIAGYVGAGSTIENCYNTGSMPVPDGTTSTVQYVGGIAGYAIESVIRNCFNTGTFYGYQNVGGIVGYLEGVAFVYNCYNLGGINGLKYSSSTPATYIGAIVGQPSGRTAIASCYYLVGCASDDLGNIQSGIGSDDCTVPGDEVPGSTVACTDAQLKQQSTFACFDFANVWKMGGADYPYPVLRGVNDMEKTDAQTPVIFVQTNSVNCAEGEVPTLFACSSVTDGGTLTYQWYICDTADGTYTAVPGAIHAAYQPAQTSGTKYYYVTVTNTNKDATGVQSVSVNSCVTAVTVGAAAKTYTITGTLITYGDKADVTIELLLNGEVVRTETVPNTAGTTLYTLDNVPAGTYTVRVSKDKHISRTYEVTVGNP